ncbi:MAG: endonuclease domain-containing protein [Allosphingosinicella sp.]
MRGTTKKTVQKARALRRQLTRPEARLWQILRDRPDDLKFRKQHPIGPYVLDFYCPAAKLGIEVDGDAHDMGTAPEDDARRDAWLRGKGLRILRIPARHLYGDIEPAVMLILSHCRL